MRPTVRLAATVIPAVALFLCPSNSDPATIRVPADQPTIAAALAAALPGDEVVVDCGTYHVLDLQVPTQVTLRSVTGAPGCVILGPSTAYRPAVRADSTQGVRLVGLTFANVRYGVAATAASNLLLDSCSFEESLARKLVNIVNSDAVVRNCTFSENRTALGSRRGQRYDEVSVGGGSVTVESSLFQFTNATMGYGGGGIAFHGGGPHVIRDSRFEYDSGVLLEVDHANLEVQDTWFEGGVNLHYTWRYGHILDMVGGTARVTRCTFATTGRYYGSNSSQALHASGGADLVVEACTFFRDGYVALFEGSGSALRVDRTILAQSRSDRLFRWPGGPFSVACSDIWLPAGIVFDETSPPETSGVFLADPRFCGTAESRYFLDAGSPCVPGNSPCGELVGAWPQGCGTVRLEPVTWGRIKTLYR